MTRGTPTGAPGCRRAAGQRRERDQRGEALDAGLDEVVDRDLEIVRDLPFVAIGSSIPSDEHLDPHRVAVLRRAVRVVHRHDVECDVEPRPLAVRREHLGRQLERRDVERPPFGALAGRHPLGEVDRDGAPALKEEDAQRGDQRNDDVGQRRALVPWPARPSMAARPSPGAPRRSSTLGQSIPGLGGRRGYTALHNIGLRRRLQ